MRLEYIFIKSKNDFCKNVDQFRKFLETNERLSFSAKKLQFSKLSFDYNLTAKNVIWRKKPESVFHLNIRIEKTGDEIARILEKLDRLLKRINKTNGEQFTVYTIWDDVSLYYTQKLYPQMAEVENLLRNVIYRLMINVAGSKWFDSTAPIKVKEAIDSITQKQSDSNECDQLYDADFRRLGDLLFISYSIKPLNNNFLEELKKVDLSGEEAKNKIERLIEFHELKSNWDRYFAGKINIDSLADKWQRLNGYRNQIAHVKRMSTDEYNDSLILITEIKDALLVCLEHIDEVKMSEEEVEAAHEVVQETIARKTPEQIVMDSIDSSEIRNLGAIIQESIDAQPAIRALKEAITEAIPITSEMRELENSGKIIINKITEDKAVGITLGPELMESIKENETMQRLQETLAPLAEQKAKFDMMIFRRGFEHE